jgi:cholinesterase
MRGIGQIRSWQRGEFFLLLCYTRIWGRTDWTRAGPFHGSEIGLVFGTTEYQQTFFSEMTNEKISYPDTAEQKSLTKMMMTAWATFAKDPENGLDRLGWPVYDEKSEILHLP